MSSYCLKYDYLLELGQAVQLQEGKYSMLKNTIDIIKHLSHEDCKTILLILSKLARITYDLIVLYQSKQYQGKHIIKKQTKIDYKLIFDFIDLIIGLVG